MKIIGVNGKALSTPEIAAIDSGNSSFLSFAPASALRAATEFPFSLTFEGGATLTFTGPPIVQGKITKASPYNHNVIALGFMSNFHVTFDDANNVVYFESTKTTS